MRQSLPDDRHSLADCLRDARERTLAAVSDLDERELRPPRSAIVNPFLWEIGHVTWFQEYWLLRRRSGATSVLDVADALYDSAKVAHDTRWEIPLLDREATRKYARIVLDHVIERLEQVELDPEQLYFHRLVLFHEDMHLEAFHMMRQTLGFACPPAPAILESLQSERSPATSVGGDREIAGGRYELGAPRGAPFVFDNEQWQHEVVLAPFALARAPVTQAEFTRFVEDGGYERRELWTDEGWRWRERVQASHPVYWRRPPGEPDRWERRAWNAGVALEPRLPVHHVCAHEADAYCRWAGRRLPSEAEWECAASWEQPWPESNDHRGRANLDLVRTAPVSVDAHGPRGCAQMVGNVWEWTASSFLPYPGFEPGPYREYSLPWFGDHRVLRGGSFATRARLLRRTMRNFYLPWRRDVIAGFRTAATGC